MNTHSFQPRAKAQAIVEFALAATMIFMLLAAAIDLGLIFLARQGLRMAAQEGATFGSYPAFSYNNNGQVDKVYLNTNAIRERVRMSAGTTGGPAFVNLLDLNNDKAPDTSTILEKYITVNNFKDTNGDAKVPENPVVRCTDTDMKTNPDLCYIQVIVIYDYKPIFALAPALADTVPIEVSFTMGVRSTYRETK